MRQGLCNGTVSRRLCLSVCPFVCPIYRTNAAAACGGFAAVGPAGRRYRSVAAWPALSRNCESVTLSADVGYKKLSAHLLLIYADVFRGRRSTYHPADYASEDGVSYVVFFVFVF